MVPALKTRSGDPDLLDAEQLAELLGREQTAPTGEELESNISEMGQVDMFMDECFRFSG